MRCCRVHQDRIDTREKATCVSSPVTSSSSASGSAEQRSSSFEYQHGQQNAVLRQMSVGFGASVSFRSSGLLLLSTRSRTTSSSTDTVKRRRRPRSLCTSCGLAAAAAAWAAKKTQREDDPVWGLEVGPTMDRGLGAKPGGYCTSAQPRFWERCRLSRGTVPRRLGHPVYVIEVVCRPGRRAGSWTTTYSPGRASARPDPIHFRALSPSFAKEADAHVGRRDASKSPPFSENGQKKSATKIRFRLEYSEFFMYALMYVFT